MARRLRLHAPAFPLATFLLTLAVANGSMFPDQYVQGEMLGAPTL